MLDETHSGGGVCANSTHVSIGAAAALTAADRCRLAISRACAHVGNGPFELVFNSPSSHRVHRAWDRLFGTYVPEDEGEPVRFASPPRSGRKTRSSSTSRGTHRSSEVSRGRGTVGPLGPDPSRKHSLILAGTFGRPNETREGSDGVRLAVDGKLLYVFESCALAGDRPCEEAPPGVRAAIRYLGKQPIAHVPTSKCR